MRGSNPGQLGKKHERYRCAVPSLLLMKVHLKLQKAVISGQGVERDARVDNRIRAAEKTWK